MALPTPTKTTRADGIVLWQYDWPTESVTVEAADKASADVKMQACLDDKANAAGPYATNAATMRQRLIDRMQDMLDLATAIDANTATAAQQRQALALCLRGEVRLTRLAFGLLDQAP